MAPLPAEGGASFDAASATDIRLISETVIMAVGDVNFTWTNDPGDVLTGTGAIVTADFVLNNPKNSPQTLKVGFPLQIPAQANQPGSAFASIHDLRAFVGDNEAETTVETVGQETWSAWQMSFAPGETHVRVTYDLPATTDACNAELGYVLHTGAAWAGPIGQADLIVRYPYAAEATFVSPHGIYLGNSTPGYRVAGTDLRWHYDNLEPTPANDLAVTFVTPECWLKVAGARAALNQQASAENYWHLASAYADIVFPHHGFYSPLIAQVADAQFKKALALDPKNPEINAAYAEYLDVQVGDQGELLGPSHQPSKIQQCLVALPLAPHDDQLLYACVPILNAAIGDPNVSANVQATVAAVLTAAPLPTFPPRVSSTPVNPTAAPSAVASPSLVPSPTVTLGVTETAAPPPTATTAPPPATSTPIAVAQVTAAVAPTPVPVAPPSSGLPWTAVLTGVAVLLLAAAGVFYWRQRPGGQVKR